MAIHLPKIHRWAACTTLLICLTWLPYGPAQAAFPYAGTYEGTFTGDDHGSWRVSIGNDGKITGSGFSAEDGPFGIAGSVTTTGAFAAVAGDVTEGSTYKGTVKLNGTIAGTWTNTFWNERGTFTGRKTGSKKFNVHIVARAFIPTPFVVPPAQYLTTDLKCKWLNHTGLIHVGDNRIKSGLPVFDVNAKSFRIEQVVDVSATIGADIDISATAPPARANQSMEYAFDALADGVLDKKDIDGVARDCHLLNRVDRAKTINLKAVPKVVSNGVVEVRLFGGAKDPLVRLSPNIDWDITIRLDFTKDKPNYSVRGEHDMFPAYELYINNVTVYTFSPGPPARRLEVTTPTGKITFQTYAFEQISRLEPPYPNAVISKEGILP